MKKTYPQTPEFASLTRQPFTQLNTLTIAERRSVIRALEDPDCRYTLPLSRREKLLLRLSRHLHRVDIFGGSFVFQQGSLSPCWQIIFKFLQINGITQDAAFPAVQIFENDDPKFPCAQVRGITRTSSRDGYNLHFSGYGAGADLDEAYSKAFGELLERHFLGTYQSDLLFRSSADSLTSRNAAHVDPAMIASVTPSSAEICKDLRATDLAWVRGTDLSSLSPVLIPAQLVYWGYDVVAASEPALTDRTTSGGGGFFTRDGAYLSSIYETVQRDGFLIYWLNSLSPAIIDVESVLTDYPRLKNRLELAHRYGIRPLFLNLTSDLPIPSLACVIVDDREENPVITVGAGTGSDFETIALAALEESLLVHQFQHRSKPYVLPHSYVPFNDASINRAERLALWKGAENLERFRFFISGKRQSVAEFIGSVRSFPNEAAELKHVIDVLASSGYRVYGYEVQNEILERLGYHVTKVVIPGLVPLYLREHMAPLAADRLRLVPPKLGLDAAEQYNPWPHPFP